MRVQRSKLGFFLIAAGLIMLALPLYRLSMGVYFQRVELAALERAEAADPVLVEPDESSKPETVQNVLLDLLPDINGLLEIPRIDLIAVVIHGVTDDHLRRGPGFYSQSKHPEAGNVAIAAHRGAYGSWFRNINRLRPGDEIYLTLGDVRYRYEVREQFVTHSRDWSVIESKGYAELTLTTCLFTNQTERLIVKADLIKVGNVPY